jgi:hypothetical protein
MTQSLIHILLIHILLIYLLFSRIVSGHERGVQKRDNPPAPMADLWCTVADRGDEPSGRHKNLRLTYGHDL